MQPDKGDKRVKNKIGYEIFLIILISLNIKIEIIRLQTENIAVIR